MVLSLHGLNAEIFLGGLIMISSLLAIIFFVKSLKISNSQEIYRKYLGASLFPFFGAIIGLYIVEEYESTHLFYVLGNIIDEWAGTIAISLSIVGFLIAKILTRHIKK